MCSIPIFVGLDYHQESVQVCVLNARGEQMSNVAVENDVNAIERAASRHGRPERMAIEACCGAANLAEVLATERGHVIHLAHPGYVARMKRSPDKTDLGDAQLLADLTRVNYLPQVWLAPEPIRQLRRLVRHRTQLVRRRTEIKLRVRGLLRENRLKGPAGINAWTKTWLGWLKHEVGLGESDRFVMDDHLAELESLSLRIRQTEQKIERQVGEDPLVAQLQELPGVGLVTAVTLRAEVGRFDRFDTGKQLARFCGVTPRNASSGTRQADAGLIRAGNPELRRVLIELAHRLIRLQHPHWRKLAASLLKRGKAKNVVVAAVANRWVRWLHHELRRERSAPARQKGTAPAPTALPVAST